MKYFQYSSEFSLGGEFQKAVFIFFESLDCSLGARSSKGTGADLPDVAKTWPDRDMMQPASANHGHDAV